MILQNIEFFQELFFSLDRVCLYDYHVFSISKIRFLHKSLTLAYPSRMDLFSFLRISISDNDMRFYSLLVFVRFSLAVLDFNSKNYRNNSMIIEESNLNTKYSDGFVSEV